MLEPWRVLQNIDLGVQVHGSLKMASQMDSVVKEVIGTFAFKKVGIEY